MLDNRKTEEVPTPFEEALDEAGHGVYNMMLVATCSLILLAIGMDMFGFSLVVVAACDLQLSVVEKGILTSLPFCGILLMSYFWGYISDTRGRRYALVIPLMAAFSLSCISSLSPHWIFLGVGKFLSVCCSCAANSATYTLVGESCVQRVRSKYMVLMTCLIILSPGAAAAVSYPTLKLDFAATVPWLGVTFTPWRLVIIVLALPTFAGAAALYFFYESPKFLFNCGRKDEALEVLRSIYAVNHRQPKDGYKVTSLVLEGQQAQKEMSLCKALYEQSAALFRPPYLWRSIQLYYIVAVVYITNNSFLVWLPHVMNLVRVSLATNVTTDGLCSLIDKSQEANNTINAPSDVCLGTIGENLVFTIIGSQVIFSSLNLIISYLPNRRKTVLITILCASALSGFFFNLTPELVSGVILFIMFTSTCLAMGILASYFVDLYPTSYRGMAACLSIMVGRSSTFVGINIISNFLFSECQLTFYIWSLFVLSSVVAACFLPPDIPKNAKTAGV